VNGEDARVDLVGEVERGLQDLDEGDEEDA